MPADRCLSDIDTGFCRNSNIRRLKWGVTCSYRVIVGHCSLLYGSFSLFPSTWTLWFSHQNSLHQESNPPTGCVNKAPPYIISSYYVDATSSVHEKGQPRSCVCEIWIFSVLFQCSFVFVHSFTSGLGNMEYVQMISATEKMSQLLIMYILLIFCICSFCSAWCSHAIKCHHCRVQFKAHSS